MTRETARSFPGIGRDDSTTVSPGPTASDAVLAQAHQRQGGQGLALAARHEQRLRGGRERARGVARHQVGRGDAQQAEVDARPPRCPPCGGRGTPTRRPRARAMSATRWMRGTDVAKQETSTRPGVRANTSSNAGSTSSSPPVRPRVSTFVLSESSASTPRSPQARERLEVGWPSGGAVRSILKSPVASTTPAGVSIARARLSVTLCATRIGCTRKGPISTGCPGESVRRSAATLALAQASPREAEREAAAVDRGAAPPQRERAARRCGPRGRG